MKGIFNLTLHVEGTSGFLANNEINSLNKHITYIETFCHSLYFYASLISSWSIDHFIYEDKLNVNISISILEYLHIIP